MAKQKKNAQDFLRAPEIRQAHGERRRCGLPGSDLEEPLFDEDGGRSCSHTDKKRRIIFIDPDIPAHWMAGLLAGIIGKLWNEETGRGGVGETLPLAERVGDKEFYAIMGRVM